MSGGHFSYQQYQLKDLSDQLIELAGLVDKGDFRLDNPVTFSEHIQFAAKLCKLASVYVHRIDWLVSGDDGEKTFYEQLEKDVQDLGLTDIVLFKDETKEANDERR